VFNVQDYYVQDMDYHEPAHRPHVSHWMEEASSETRAVGLTAGRKERGCGGEKWKWKWRWKEHNRSEGSERATTAKGLGSGIRGFNWDGET